MPAPTKAPMREWVVEIGIPSTVASITVLAAPTPIAIINSGFEMMAEDTRPFPLNALISPFERYIEKSDPKNVVAVAQ